MNSELQKSLWELGFLPSSFMERESSGSCLYHVSWRGSLTVLNDRLLSPNRSPHISTHSLHMHAYSLLLICISSASAKRTISLLLQDLYQCVKKKKNSSVMTSKFWAKTEKFKLYEISFMHRSMHRGGNERHFRAHLRRRLMLSSLALEANGWGLQLRVW